MSDISREIELISDAEITRVHGYANFGDMTPRDVIRDGVVKYAMGYTGGHTQLSILIEHALIHKPKPGSYQSTLTKKGRAYLRAIMPTWGVLTAIRASITALEAQIAAADRLVDLLDRITDHQAVIDCLTLQELDEVSGAMAGYTKGVKDDLGT